MKHFENISDFYQVIGKARPEHPLFCVSYGSGNECMADDMEFSADFYIIGFKSLKSGSIMYGNTKYDHDHGKMSFTRPRQRVAYKDVRMEEACFLILVHEDFLLGTALHHDIKKYHYFDYDANEALYLSPAEEETIWTLIRTIHKEYHNNTDDYSRTIILSHFDTLLKYAQRFYKRQFINRAEITGAVTTKFNNLLGTYFEGKKTVDSGLPTVSVLAEKLHLSPRYLSDLLKQETGKTALELIHLYLISEAKNLLKEGELNIAEISFSLGFENPNYFSRLFKREVGISPHLFRMNGAN